MLTANEYYRSVFGCKIYKLSLDGGFTCPNRDGTLGYGGCTFCSAMGSGEFSAHGAISQQLSDAKARVAAKNKGGKYIAYFQSFTGTYAPVPLLQELYTQAIAPEEVVGLSIATRPDCLGKEVLDLLETLNRQKPVSVELGLQTIHDATARRFHRGYDSTCYLQAVTNLKERGIHVVTHIILGLPGETLDMAVETTRCAITAGTDGVKFHLLHILRGSAMERDYADGKLSVLSLEEYSRWLIACLSVLPEKTVVYRITGDGAKKDLIAPLWSADKKRVLNYLNTKLKEAGLR